MSTSDNKSYLYAFDVLRFGAAFLVFFGHYVHFYMYFTIPENKGHFFEINPDIGALAVPVFFLMSGAIFEKNYADAVANKKVTFVSYMHNRLTRLYPLHLATLLVVCIFQYLIYKSEGKFFIYNSNDLKHFVLNIFFASHWGAENGNSFNSSVWSVSHEILLYIAFFIVAQFFYRLLGKHIILPIILLVLCIFYDQYHVGILKSAIAFFFGVFIYALVHFLKNRFPPMLVYCLSLLI